MTLRSQSADELLAALRDGRELSSAEQLSLLLRLSLPAMVAQISVIAMQYIDASMVGHLGANASAAIGILMSTTWLFFGVCGAAVIGFTVPVSHLIGAKNFAGARALVRQCFTVSMAGALAVMVLALAIRPYIAGWLGAAPEIIPDATSYFFYFALSIPFVVLEMMAGGLLRASGNIKTPSQLNVLLCVLDVIFNFLLIFPTETRTLFGVTFTTPGAGLGVTGAAIGTLLSDAVIGLVLLWCLFVRSPILAIVREKGSWRPQFATVKRAFILSFPIGLQRFLMTSGQVVLMTIVSPLGVASIAAHSLATTAESLCYMPGYGVSEAATTMIGQSIGAKRLNDAKKFAGLSVGLGAGIMTLMGVIMYVFADELMYTLTNDPEVVRLGAEVLRIEAFAEPLFAVSIVAFGCLVGAGDTKVPAALNMLSMWGVRLTLAAWLAPKYGLVGVWIAMATELCVRGLLMLARLLSGRWLRLRSLAESAN
jgi:putative MATE family efflux protein